jgi:RNA polymerase sigma-70 factor (ECF subfamily)
MTLAQCAGGRHLECPEESAMNDLAHQLATLRPALVRVARKRVRNPAWAEDAVSDTVMAALENPASFSGRAQLQTWLVGILKHKLVDQIRSHGREQCLADGDTDDDDSVDAWDDRTPLWSIDAGAGRGDPQDKLERRQFMQQLDHSIKTLPAQQGRAFVLRECLELETDDVCRELGVTANNLSVMLHRARQRLRSSLAPLWMPTPAGPRRAHA